MYVGVLGDAGVQLIKSLIYLYLCGQPINYGWGSTHKIPDILVPLDGVGGDPLGFNS